MINTYTAKYAKISSGYMGQIIEWPEVITEGKTIEECREMLEDALREMIAACRQENTEVRSDERCWNKSRSRFRMPVKRRDLIKHLEESGFYLLREGRKHSVYSNGEKKTPI